MNTYSPDRWVIVEIKFNDTGKSERKILSSWYGGYLGSDSWRLSSGIVQIIEYENHYEIHNNSGSVYNCNKSCTGMSGYTASVYEKLKKQLSESDMASMEIVNL